MRGGGGGVADVDCEWRSARGPGWRPTLDVLVLMHPSSVPPFFSKSAVLRNVHHSLGDSGSYNRRPQ